MIIFQFQNRIQKQYCISWGKTKIEEFIREIQYAENMQPRKFNDDGELDDELFVLKLLIADVHQRLVSGAKQNFLVLNI